MKPLGDQGVNLRTDEQHLQPAADQLAPSDLPPLHHCPVSHLLLCRHLAPAELPARLDFIFLSIAQRLRHLRLSLAPHCADIKMRLMAKRAEVCRSAAKRGSRRQRSRSVRQRKRRRRLLSSKQRDGTVALFALLMDQKQKVAPPRLQRASWPACAAPH